jgi:hypothetical protein
MWTMSSSVTIRARVLAAAALAGLAAATGMLAFGMGPFGSRGHATTAADVAPRPPAAPAPKANAKPATPTKSKAPTAHAAPAKPAQPVDEAPVAATPAVETASKLPAPVAAALASHDVVVVSLVSPSAPVDEIALREARAGAAAAKAGFVRLPVGNQKDMEKLTAAVGVRHTPAVLVFTRPDKLFLHVTGFADRQTVAQAAANAPS